LAIEDELGYIPKEAVAEVAAFTRSTVNDVWAVASFYPNFRFEPPCEHQVELCWGSSCHLVGAMSLIDQVLQASGLQEEGDTPDRKLTVRLNTCLGACAQAPVISIDHRLIGRLSPQEAGRKVAELLAGAASH
jgi:NADH-quinone oxidoreductase subunit E